MMAHRALLIIGGRMDYQAAWQRQRQWVHERAEARRPDTLWLLEHDPVFTVGRTGQPHHWGGDVDAMAVSGIPIYHVERGGSITFHGPGQAVGYPILRLTDYCSGPKAYMRLLEEVLIRLLGRYGVVGYRRERLTGVWVDHPGPCKIAAMGVKIERGMTMHGFALNVAMDLSPFHRIVPCGITDCRVTSMAEVLGHAPNVRQVQRDIAEQFAAVFDVAWEDELASIGHGADRSWEDAHERI